MLARIRRATKDTDQGFTLIELLVVMIIIGILAAIAIPVFLSQRAKARDTATKADVSTAGKEIASYYVDGTSTLVGTVTAASGSTPGSLTISTGTPVTAANTVATIKLSDGTAAPTAGVITNLTLSGACTVANSWVVGLTNAAGSQKTYYYSAQNGLSTTAPTTCA